jgi:hypothetical protein
MGVKNNSNSSWRKKYRQQAQIAALLLAVLSPFGIFAALQSGSPLLAGLGFAVFAFAMLLTALVG